MKNLAELLNSIEVLEVIGKAEKCPVEKITVDSREATKGSLFVAIKGFKTDSHEYIMDVIAAGASAIILENSEKIPQEFFKHFSCVIIHVRNSRKALAEISSAFFSFPSQQIKLAGITGTKGKTSTAYMIWFLLNKLNAKSALTGTIFNIIGEEKEPAKLTTPESYTINEFLNKAVLSGCTNAVMEVSSHGIALERTRSLDFDVACFTQLSSDHLDFHNSYEDYRDTKKRLFDELKPEAIAVYNIDDKYGEYMVSDCRAKKISVGKKEDAIFQISDLNYNIHGTSYNLTYQNVKYSVKTPLVGEFNCYNTSIAFAVVVTLGLTPEKAVELLKNAPQVPGRFEILRKAARTVIVDYSHNAESLRQALIAVNDIISPGTEIWTVFGCGGDRDKTKRPVMGKIASDMSTKVIVTSDNPRFEDPEIIINEICSGIEQENFITITDREEAIEFAVTKSSMDSVILIAGKGHENYSEVKGMRTYFSDKETAEKYLNE